jgi:hypothetical protein
MEKSKEWDAMDTQDNELVAALELELYAGDCGVPVEALQLSEIESDGAEEREHAVAAAAAAEGAIEVVDGDSENSSVDSDTDSVLKCEQQSIVVCKQDATNL